MSCGIAKHDACTNTDPIDLPMLFHFPSLTSPQLASYCDFEKLMNTNQGPIISLTPDQPWSNFLDNAPSSHRSDPSGSPSHRQQKHDDRSQSRWPASPHVSRSTALFPVGAAASIASSDPVRCEHLGLLFLASVFSSSFHSFSTLFIFVSLLSYLFICSYDFCYFLVDCHRQEVSSTTAAHFGQLRFRRVAVRGRFAH